MELQVEKNSHFRHVLLFEFNRGVKAVEAARTIRNVYGEAAITDRAAQKWFSRFRDGNFDLSDADRQGRTPNFDEERLDVLLHENPRQTTRELAVEMECDQSTIVRHLQSMGKVQKLGAWVPHALSQNNKDCRVIACASLLARHRLARQQHQSFLSRIITGDEKWCLYVNFKQRKEWLSPDKQATPRVKQDLHPRKTMLCVWWNQEGVVYYELLPRNQTITAELYCKQLRRLQAAIPPEKRAEVIFQHDNARPHTANLTKMVIQELEWEVLTHPAYSPDLAPSDFHLFRSLSNNLRGISFNNDVELQNWLHEFFASKPANFYKQGIQKLPERWEAVVNNAGEYLID